MNSASAPSPPSEGASVARATDYSVRKADLSLDRAVIVNLWSTYAGPAEKAEAKYQWFYLEHPCEWPSLTLLLHGPGRQPVGVAGMGIRRVSVQGTVSTAAVLADLVVLPDHRTLFPAMLLQKEMRREALERHCMVYGFPNKNSEPIIRRLGYVELGKLIRYVVVLRHADYLKRWLPSWFCTPLSALFDFVLPICFKPYAKSISRWRGAWVDLIDARFDALWNRVKSFNGVMGVRDASFLSWRFLSQPGHRYRVFVAGPPEMTEINGYAVCECEGSVMHVRDLLVDPSRPDDLRQLVYLLSRDAFRQGFARLSLEFLGAAHLHQALVSVGLVERGGRSLFGALQKDAKAAPKNFEFYVTSADEDQ